MAKSAFPIREDSVSSFSPPRPSLRPSELPSIRPNRKPMALDGLGFFLIQRVLAIPVFGVCWCCLSWASMLEVHAARRGAAIHLSLPWWGAAFTESGSAARSKFNKSSTTYDIYIYIHFKKNIYICVYIYIISIYIYILVHQAFGTSRLFFTN